MHLSLTAQQSLDIAPFTKKDCPCGSYGTAEYTPRQKVFIADPTTPDIPCGSGISLLPPNAATP